ncbi:MAG: nuclear transport factor 2 family protein [Alphaproteobacteria bacterium]
MATSSSTVSEANFGRDAAAFGHRERNHQTIEGMVAGFAVQDIDGIMRYFADNAVYYDILGKGPLGDEYHGKPAIREAFVRQFDLNGSHTFNDAKIVVEGDTAFASWTLVIGDPDYTKTPRFEGIDQFAFDANGQVIMKKAWLKGQPRLRRQLVMRNPAAFFRHLGYTLRSWRR